MAVPTHTAYTPVWEPGGDRFKAWLAIGSGSYEAGSEIITGQIDMLPFNPEDFTGHIRFVKNGAPPPAPLTATREEFLSELYGIPG